VLRGASCSLLATWASRSRPPVSRPSRSATASIRRPDGQVKLSRRDNEDLVVGALVLAISWPPLLDRSQPGRQRRPCYGPGDPSRHSSAILNGFLARSPARASGCQECLVLFQTSGSGRP